MTSSVIGVRAGTIMVEAPKTGAPKDKCIVCTGPRCDCGHDHIGEAFLVGMLEGVLAVLTTRAHLPTGRAPLCVDHETMLREFLADHAQRHPEILTKLGIPYRVA